MSCHSFRTIPWPSTQLTTARCSCTGRSCILTGVHGTRSQCVRARLSPNVTREQQLSLSSSSPRKSMPRGPFNQTVTREPPRPPGARSRSRHWDRRACSSALRSMQRNLPLWGDSLRIFWKPVNSVLKVFFTYAPYIHFQEKKGKNGQ